MKYIVVLLLTVASLSCYAQLCVRDRESHNPVGGATVRIHNGTVNPSVIHTAPDGMCRLPFYPVVISVEVVGYENYRDTIKSSPGIITIFLKPLYKQLEDVVVTGQSQPVVVSKSIYPVKVLGTQRIQDRGAVNMMDLLTNEMNIRVVSDNILGSNIIMQGITGQNVKVLVDGVPQISGEANEFDLQQLNLNHVERVELIEGPLSVQYGTNALAGTINLITKQLNNSGKIQGSTSQYFESVGQYNGNIWLGKNIKGWNILGSGGYTWFNGYASNEYKSTVNTPDGTVRGKNWNPKQQLSGNIKLYKRFGGITAGVSYNQFYEDNKALGNADPSTSYLTANDYRFLTNRNSVLLFANGQLPKHGYLDIVNSYAYYGMNSQQYLVNLQNSSKKEISGSLTSFTSWVFRASYSRTDIGKARYNYQVGYDINLNNSSGDQVSDNAGRIDDIGGWISAGVTVFKKLALQGGLRYTYNNRYDAKEINFLGTKLPVISSFNLRWQIGKGWSISGSYARGFRAPSQRELFWDFKDANHYIVGNPSLRPELAHNFIVQTQWLHQLKAGVLSVQSGAFLNRITDKIELVELDRSTLPAQFQTINVARTYSNIPDFETMGVNLNVGYSHADKWQLKPSWGILWRSGSNSLHEKFGSMEAGMYAMYKWSLPAIRFTVFYKYNGPMAEFGIDSSGQVVDRTLGAYSLLDISAGKQLLAGKLTITIGGKNLLNVTDVKQTGDGTDGLILRSGFKPALSVAWGRTVFIKAVYSF